MQRMLRYGFTLTELRFLLTGLIWVAPLAMLHDTPAITQDINTPMFSIYYRELLSPLLRSGHAKLLGLSLPINSFVSKLFRQSSIELFPRSAPLADSSQSSRLKLHYLIDLEYGVDHTMGFGRIPHLSVFNPGIRNANLRITAFYSDREPSTFERVAPAQTSSESDASTWPVALNSRFALQIESSEPIVVQATQGWNNTSNIYSTQSPSTASGRPRETAKSYLSITSLASEYYVADGIVIDAPDDTWIRETEDVVLLNPGKTELPVTIYVYYGERKVTSWAPPLKLPVFKRQISIPPERLALVPMTGRVKSNWHYGARIAGDQPFAAQWLRTVYWYDSAEIMSEWSLPCVPMV